MYSKDPVPYFNWQTFRIGTAAYLILIGLAAVFYLERMTGLDMAFQSFQILRTESLQIQSGRFGAAATQVFAWAAQALGLPLKGVLLSYSLGHALYYFGLFFLITKVWKQWEWGLVLLMSTTLMVSHTFYWLSEMPQGLAFLITVLAWLDHKGNLNQIHWWEYPLFGLSLVTAFYFHPMVLYPLLFCAGFFILSNRERGHKVFYGMTAGLFILIAFIKYKVLPLDWYDAMSLGRTKAFSETWPHWLDIKSNRDFVRWCLTDYYMVPAIWLLSTVFYLWKKQWLKVLFISFSLVGFLLLVNVPFHQGDNQFYLENLYLPMTVFVAVPLIFDVLPGLLPSKWVIGPVVLIAFIGIVRIYQTHELWSARVNWERDFIEKTSDLAYQKLLLTEEQVPMDTLILSWSSAYEFLLLSALDKPEDARCILIDESAFRFDSLLAQSRLFLGEFQNYPFEALPQQYFSLEDTSAYVRY